MSSIPFRAVVGLCSQFVQQRGEMFRNGFPNHIGKMEPQRRRNGPGHAVPFGNQPFNDGAIEP